VPRPRFVLAASAMLVMACSSATSPSDAVAGTWTLTIDGLQTTAQSTAAATCPQSIRATLALAQVNKNSFTGTYSAAPASCSGPSDSTQIVRASGTLSGVIDKAGHMTFSLDTQKPLGGAFTGTTASDTAAGTVEFDSATMPQIRVSGTWSAIRQ
jgi:hypothetical protein